MDRPCTAPSLALLRKGYHPESVKPECCPPFGLVANLLRKWADVKSGFRVFKAFTRQCLTEVWWGGVSAAAPGKARCKVGPGRTVNCSGGNTPHHASNPPRPEQAVSPQNSIELRPQCETSDNPQTTGNSHSLGPTTGIQLGVNIPQVGPYRTVGDKQLLRHGTVGISLRQ